jgi:hypothetical protein
MVRFVVGRGDNRQVVEKASKGKVFHEQRRALKTYCGLLKGG